MLETPVSDRRLNHRSWASSIAGFLCWAAASASIVAWGLAFWPNDAQPLASNVAMTHNLNLKSVVSAADLGKVLGDSPRIPEEPATPSLVSRLVLVGVAQSGPAFSALIAVDGQAAKPFNKGAEVLPGVVLQAVTLQQAHLGAQVGGPVQFSLDMPQRAEPARGVLQ